jgi:hypothetical protein
MVPLQTHRLWQKFDPNERRNFAMTTFGLAIHKVQRRILPVGALIAATLSVAAAQAQTAEPKSPAEARVVVVGEGSVTVAPDYARIRSGVSTNAKTVKEASDTNSKLMANIIATLVDAGVAKKDIQTSEFSIEPVYISPIPPSGPKLSGYRVSNQVNVTIHQISQVSEVLDRLSGCDRCREHSVSHFRPRKSARPSPRGGNNQRPAQGRTLCARLRSHSRARRMDHGELGSSAASGF